ncbi:MAG: hypothetical protein Q8R83_01660 [Legionellaceae bacterium]|nr:hypothetical protein [Legionellaceae bacterium]
MHNKYIKQFFALTEQNILGNHESANESFIQSDKKESSKAVQLLRSYRLRFMILLIAPATALLFHTPHSNIPPKPVEIKLSQPVLVAPKITHPVKLTSTIPGFRVAAIHQFLQNVPLRIADASLSFDQLDENQQTASTEPLMDKVLVIPKSFG